MWAAIYPGQGSQQPGMGKFLYEQFPRVKQIFEEASDALSLNMRKLCFDGSEADLALTENTQPCLLLVSFATFQVLKKELGFAPKIAAGHSIGEYAAVVSGEALNFADGLRAVRTRGQAMQAAVPMGVGGMTAVMGLKPDQVFELCAWAEKESGEAPVSPANINAPGQIVISGKKALLDWIPLNLKPEHFEGSPRVKFIPLKVSAPFHCALMKPAEATMENVLGELKFVNSSFPIVQNVNAFSVREGAELRKNLVAQVSRPVRWIECVEKMRTEGATKLIEVGCGKVLNGLVKKIDSEGLKTFNVNSLEDIKILEPELKDAQ